MQDANLPPQKTISSKEVFGEAFFKKLQGNAAFLKKGGTQKLPFLILA
ncbi:hypothetical protein HNW77_15955 [Komagataeibacter sp. AV436]|uniref:Uncharacterized protein n=1 Tax=Komagataeibacter melomenusus TaxID=2766578 RepID=A0ABX2AI41_9PROT|nr:hypothetical protein [Komagataeibacter melomenusus]MBV1832024.1 hypothetical protein [Komagataeibacter melomenusus]NPC67838.1 hypothetical protein [Komagataeibacter melomenusus]